MSFDELTENAAGEAEAIDLAKVGVPGVAAQPIPVSTGISLDQVPLGSTAVLGSPDQLNPTILRLLEMGFTPGAPLQITRRAPGGDPVEVRVRGTRLCVRRADLARFSVASVTHAKAKSRNGK